LRGEKTVESLIPEPGAGGAEHRIRHWMSTAWSAGELWEKALWFPAGTGDTPCTEHSRPVLLGSLMLGASQAIEGLTPTLQCHGKCR
jgi:hypothetical protein